MAINKEKPCTSRGSSLEIPRRIYHSLAGFILPALWYCGVTPDQCSLLVAPLTLAYGLVEVSRFCSGTFNDRFCQSFPFRYILRTPERECQNITSSMYYLIGIHLTALFFEPHVAYLAAMYLFWCDPAAGLAGRAWGHRLGGGIQLRRGKSLAGFLGAALTGSLITASFLYLTVPNLGWVAWWTSAILGGMYAALSELLGLEGVDDNLTLPLIAGTLLTYGSPIIALYS